MKKSTKVYLAVTGILLIICGIICVCNPAATLISMAWLLGLLALIGGFSTFGFWTKAKNFLPSSGGILLASILQIVVGILLLCNQILVAETLPFIFAAWILIEGINLAIQSFDYQKVGYSSWWAILLLGIAGAVLGCIAFTKPIATGATLGVLIGCGIIANGVSYLIALSGINWFEKRVGEVRNAVRSAIEEQ